ncbi:MAG: helix-turn-helix domain-containing protein, partial [Planctomycetota bacterium]|nr:helix-turn-helix domain-containing protein [Planctomycetota bacterium]
ERACFAAHLAGTDEISPEDLRLPLSADNGGMLVSLEEAQERHIKAVLARLDGNRKKAAEVLNVTERHLYRLLSRLGTQDQKHDSS